ncbi:hypothetical protein ABFT80_03330 [Mesorhizobium sp. SB112]|uniref:hypothetical protein n=1 Tax=Mesorhizobium sp. SB112 TaxID=3151853 RepID=UPI00326346F3
MHSFLVKTALAAALLSTSLGVSFAAPPDNTTSLHLGATVDQIPPPDNLATNSTMPHHMSQAGTMRPRLQRITNEIGRADHRIAVDRSHGYLSRVEAQKVRQEARMIEHNARVAANHHSGRIPNTNFVRLQERVQDLNHNIHRYATNA